MFITGRPQITDKSCKVNRWPLIIFADSKTFSPPLFSWLAFSAALASPLCWASFLLLCLYLPKQRAPFPQSPVTSMWVTAVKDGERWNKHGVQCGSADLLQKKQRKKNRVCQQCSNSGRAVLVEIKRASPLSVEKKRVIYKHTEFFVTLNCGARMDTRWAEDFV